MSHATSRATCRSNQMRDVGEVVDDEPARGEVVDERRDVPRDRVEATGRATQVK
jgi:hypothetical protein